MKTEKIIEQALRILYCGQPYGCPYFFRFYNMAFTDKHFKDIKDITTGTETTAVPAYEFAGRHSLTEVKIPDGVASIGDYAFFRCSSLSTVSIPERVVSIGEGVFWYCRSLNNIIIPQNVSHIGDYAFFGCTGLTDIIIPEKVGYIGDYTFVACNGLTDITLPNGIARIGERAFLGCGKLSVIKFNGTAKQWKSVVKGECWDKDTGKYTVRCTDGDINKNN